MPCEMCEIFQSCEKLSRRTLNVCIAVYNNPEINSQINLVAVLNPWRIGTAELIHFAHLHMILFPLSVLLFLILHLKTLFQICLCAIPK